MTRSSRLLRSLFALLAALQLAAIAGAPAFEAFVESERAQYFGDSTNIHESPEHAHDASTCPVCRLLDSPARVEAKRDGEAVAARHQAFSASAARLASQGSSSWFHSRAPPTHS